jgi:hypothetical protein
MIPVRWLWAFFFLPFFPHIVTDFLYTWHHWRTLSLLFLPLHHPYVDLITLCGISGVPVTAGSGAVSIISGLAAFFFFPFLFSFFTLLKSFRLAKSGAFGEGGSLAGIATMSRL